METGVAHVLDDHVRFQLRAGWGVVVACPGGSLALVAREAGAEVVEWQSERRPGLSVLAELRSLARVINAVEPDVVHLHSAKAGLVGRLVLRGRRPTVFTPHAWSWLAVSGGIRRAARVWERWGARWAHTIICLSVGEIADAEAARITPTPVLIPNDVPVTRLRQVAPASQEAARSMLGLDVAAPLVVCCARLAPQKGQDVLVDAWSRVVSQVPSARLALVGDGPDRKMLETRAAEIPGVNLVGMVDRDRSLAWMKAASVVACPSRYEGMSLVPMEAAALGVPVVASDVEGMGSSLSHAARTLVPPEDVDALAEELVAMLTDPARLLEGALEASRWADEAVLSGSACARTLHIYAELIARPRRQKLNGTERSR